MLPSRVAELRLTEHSIARSGIQCQDTAMNDFEWQDRCRELVRGLVARSGSIREAARLLGVNHEGMRRLVNGGPVPRGPDRAAYLSLADPTMNDTRTVGVTPSMAREATPAPYDANPRTFATDAERISYALGVLDMAGRSNRIVMETSNEVSRAISAASAALLAPLSGPTTTAPARTDAELLEADDAVLAEMSSAPAVAGAKRAKKP